MKLICKGYDREGIAPPPAPMGAFNGRRRAKHQAGRLVRLSSSVLLLIMVFCFAGNAAGSILLTAKPTSLNFGNVTIGTSKTKKITLTNTGTAGVKISAVEDSGAGFSVSALSLPYTLAAGKSITLDIEFSPVASGAAAGTITVRSHATNSPAKISLSGTGVAGTFSANPLNLAFGNVNVDSSSSLPVTLTNGGTASVTVSKVTVTGADFSTSGLSLPLTLTSGMSSNFNVIFTPTSAKAYTGSVSVVSTATNSPTTITLSGTGTTGTGGTSACVGTPLAQTPVDVTAELSDVAPGVTVTQVTTNQQNWNTYADAPAFSSPANVMTYNSYPSGPPNTVSSANLDGNNAQTISGQQQGDENYATVDGKFVYYQGRNPDLSGDIYAVPISEKGTCQQNRLTNLNWVPTSGSPQGALVISTSSIDPTSGRNVIAYAGDPLLRRVLDDGAALTTVTLGDPENANVFHRMRLNPKFSNILWYKRDKPAPNPNGAAEQEIWVVDLNSPNTVYSLSGSTGKDSPAIDHASWSNDGTQLGYINKGFWYVADVLKADGTFNLNSQGAFTLTLIGPSSASGFTVSFCNLSPDSSVYVCAQKSKAIYLMSLDGTQTKFLASPDSSPTGKIYNGIPKPRFLDMQHIIFSSDRTGDPQVYLITGFTTTFP